MGRASPNPSVIRLRAIYYGCQSVVEKKELTAFQVSLMRKSLAPFTFL
jgi:hypothetical protein